MPAELQLLIIEATILLIAYLGIYPSMRDLTMRRMLIVDLVLTALALAVGAALFAGRGIGFSLVFVETNWAVFLLLSMAAMEIPLFLWFCGRNGIDLNDPD